MKLYDTLSKTVKNFKPRENNKVQLFVCGPTVYDYTHLGHAKTYTQLDLLVRVLKASDFHVFYLQNITDIDDKIIARAREQKTTWDKLGTDFETAYKEDMDKLNNNLVTQYARATDHIEDIIKQVQTLLEKKHAYVIDDGIYFETATFEDYGKLSGRREIREDDAQTRIDQSEQKRAYSDFCLWKFSKEDEPSWPAPFGDGRPGWHIEDTAITEHFFGPQYDIHGGAVDLIFPHHEAEITQMESVSSKQPLVNYWVHVGFLNINQAKMSKSKSNFFTVREVIEKGYSPMAIRLLMLAGHYRSEIHFSWEGLDAAANRLKALQAMADLRFQPSSNQTINGADLENAKKQIVEKLQDDLNSPAALAVLSQLESVLENNGINESTQQDLNLFVQWLDEIFGLRLSTSEDINSNQKQLIKERESARAKQDWQKSDEIRANLAKQGISVRDTTAGSIWSRL